MGTRLMLGDKNNTPSWPSFLLLAALIDAVSTTPIAAYVGMTPKWQIGCSLFAVIALLIWILLGSPKRGEEEPAE